MPLVQGGPPEWIWERPAEQLGWEISPQQREGRTAFELRVNCGLEILRIQFATKAELEQLQSAVAEALGAAGR